MRVLVATDGSECADVAVDLVAALDWPTGSVIHVVEAVASGLAVFGGPWPPVPPVDTSRFDDDIRAQAEKNLAAAAERLAAPRRSVETSIVAGRAADVIVSLAEQSGADLIVLGSRGHGALETMLLGSVSSEVADHAHVPVLVARGRSVGRVVYAWVGSECAEEAAYPLTEWSVFSDADVHVLSVADVEAAQPSRSQHDQLAEEMAERLRKVGLRAIPQRRDGDPAVQIVSAAESVEADLVILGTHGRTGLRRLLMGSVARNVLAHAPCSVMLVREQIAADEGVSPGIA